MSEDTHLFDTDERMMALNAWCVADQLKQTAEDEQVTLTINVGDQPPRHVSITTRQLARLLSDL